MPDTISTPTEAALQIEAAAVERLRRQISEAAVQGQPASAQLLAEFAAVQKNYLSRKIQFEKAKRNSANSVAPGGERVVDRVDRVDQVDQVDQVNQVPLGVEERLAAKPRLSRGMFYLICATVGMALGLVLWLLLN